MKIRFKDQKDELNGNLKIKNDKQIIEKCTSFDSFGDDLAGESGS